ncbi:hypothetical protein D3C71_2105340 [compost metagenome]
MGSVVRRGAIVHAAGSIHDVLGFVLFHAGSENENDQIVPRAWSLCPPLPRTPW